MKWLPLLLILAGCASANRPERWPLRGSFLEVQNFTDTDQVVIARDGYGREWPVARVKPQSRACFRWPFVDQTGFLRTDGEDRIVTKRFEPWTASRWTWPLSGEPVASTQACR